MLEHRRLLLLTASLAISIITLIFILFFTITPDTIDALAKIKPCYLVLAIGMHIGSWLIWSCRLKIMYNFIGFHAGGQKKDGKPNELKLLQSLKIILASLFAAGITPSQFGGEPVRIYLLNKNGLTVGDGTAVVIGERVLDFVVIMIGAAISFLLFRSVLLNHKTMYAIFTVLGVFLVVAVVIMVYGLAKPEKVKKIVNFLFAKLKWKRLEKIKDRFYQEMDNFYSAIKRFQHEGKTTLGLALLFTVALWSVSFMIPSLLLLGFGEDPVWIYSFAAQFILIIIVAVPITPGGSGIAESSFCYLFQALTGATPIIGVFTLTWRLCTHYMSLIVGGITSVKILGEMS